MASTAYVLIHRALASAAVAPDEVAAVYLCGAGEPEQDAGELTLVEAVFGHSKNGGGARTPTLTALTPLTGEHAGLGGLRVAAAAMTLGMGRVPGLPDLRIPVREGLAFACDGATAAGRGRAVLVQGIGRGGGHAALVLTRAAA